MTELDRVLSTTEKTFPSIAAQLIINDCFDETFEILSNSSQSESNFASVCMHETEDMSLIDSYDVWLTRYMEANVLKYTGITYDKFLMLPRDRAEAVISKCESLDEKESAAVNGLMNSLDGKGSLKR